MPKTEGRNTAAWIYAFAAWLTALEEPITIGASEDCGRVAELCRQYCEEQGLPEVEWESNEDAPTSLLKHFSAPEEEVPV